MVGRFIRFPFAPADYKESISVPGPGRVPDASRDASQNRPLDAKPVKHFDREPLTLKPVLAGDRLVTEESEVAESVTMSLFEINVYALV
jgi:hypothetical protein